MTLNAKNKIRSMMNRLQIPSKRELISQADIEKYFLSESECVENIRNHCAARRALSEIPKTLPAVPRVFFAVKNVNWEKAGLVDSWSGVAEIVHYDWADTYDQYSTDWHRTEKQKFNDELLARVREEHQAKHIDIFFSYLSGRWVFPSTIAAIRRLGIIAINLGFDDTLSFWGKKETTGWSGNADIASSFDVCVFSCREVDIVKYNRAGARAMFLPPGGNISVFGASPPFEKRKIPVSFVGQNYGARKRIVDFLRENGIPVVARGLGWPEGPVAQSEMIDIFRDSIITLGCGYIGDTRMIQLKGRDFEAPMTGAAYVTTHCEELSRYFTPEKEILLYKDDDDLLRIVRRALEAPEKTIAIGAAGRERAIREHAWKSRWSNLLDILR